MIAAVPDRPTLKLQLTDGCGRGRGLDGAVLNARLYGRHLVTLPLARVVKRLEALSHITRVSAASDRSVRLQARMRMAGTHLLAEILLALLAKQRCNCVFAQLAVGRRHGK